MAKQVLYTRIQLLSTLKEVISYIQLANINISLEFLGIMRSEINVKYCLAFPKDFPLEMALVLHILHLNMSQPVIYPSKSKSLNNLMILSGAKHASGDYKARFSLELQ